MVNGENTVVNLYVDCRSKLLTEATLPVPKNGQSEHRVAQAFSASPQQTKKGSERKLDAQNSQMLQLRFRCPIRILLPVT